MLKNYKSTKKLGDFPAQLPVVVREGYTEKIYGTAFDHGSLGFHISEDVQRKIRADYPDVSFEEGVDLLDSGSLAFVYEVR